MCGGSALLGVMFAEVCSVFTTLKDIFFTKHRALQELTSILDICIVHDSTYINEDLSLNFHFDKTFPEPREILIILKT